MATMKDVAKAAGVSVATVSATLSGATFVSPDLRRRVLEVVEELGYQPNSTASSLKRGRSSLIGLIVPDVTNPFFTEFVDVVQRAAREAGYSVLFGVSDGAVDQEAKLIRLMRSHQATGTILAAAGAAADYANLRRDVGDMKLVVVDNAPHELDYDAVVLDNRRAATLATEHILSFGHRLIATVAGPAHRLPGAERLEGFQAALRTAQVAIPPSFVQRGDFLVEQAHHVFRNLLAGDPRPTAVFVANNQMLIGVMRAIAEAGLVVPADVSVAAIDDFPWAAGFHPALTTVRQPIKAMAETALNLLTDRTAGHAGPPRRQIFEPELVVRRSCASPVPLNRTLAVPQGRR